MAAFPSTIKWSIASSHDHDFGLAVEEMEDGRIHVQTSISATTKNVRWKIVHEGLDPADASAVVEFLRTNFADIQMTDPNGIDYTGKMASREVRESWQSVTSKSRLEWTFKGTVA